MLLPFLSPPPHHHCCYWPWLISLVERCSKCHCAILCKMTYLVVERVTFVEAYINTGSIEETRKILGRKFPGKSLPAKRAIQALGKKWHAMGSVANAPKRRPPSVHTPEITDSICWRITQSPKKSTCKLLQQAHISRTTYRRVLKSLDLKPYCVTVTRGWHCETSKLQHVASE